MPENALAELRLIWTKAGRPGQAKLRDAAKRQGLNLTVKEASDFVRAQSVAQVFAPAPKSRGKVTSPQLNERWQCDLIDFKSRSPEKNDDFRVALVCIDIFSRMLYAEPLKTKTAEEVAAAFQRVQRQARGNARIKGRAQVIPQEVSTDAGAEFRGVFSQMLEHEGVSQRFKESINSLAVVDSAIRNLKITIAKDMVDTSSESWSRALPAAVKAHNSNSHPALLGSAPEDVKGTPVLQYELEKQNGLDMAVNTNVNEQGRVQKLRELGAFRILMPKTTWARAGVPRWSEKVPEFLHIYGQDVKAVDGTTAPIRNVLPAPLVGSKDVKVPRELQPGRPIRDEGAKAALRPFADALKGFLGPTEKLSLQGAGIKLRQVPNFAEAMVEQKITGIGSFMKFLQLFPEFVVEGQAPKSTVRLA